MTPLRSKLTFPALALVLLAGLLAAPSAIGRSHARAHATSSYMAGIGDESYEMFQNPLWQQLHTRIARYIAPYDAVVHPDSLARARAWIENAETEHQQILVAFYHSEHTPMRLPSVALYKHDIEKFVRRFPKVRQYQSYDEANRGNEPGVFSSPSASVAAQYYQALIRVCKGCTAIGLDVLDAYRIGPTLEYISEFKREIGRLRTIMPRIWGLHDYSDVNRYESWRTREISHALGGEIWLTETGGIVQFGGAFPNHNGSGLSRAAKVIKYTFAVAGSQSQIKRLYLYDWTGGNSHTRFDAGLMDSRYAPRAGYVVVCKQLHGKKCGVRTSRR